MKLARFAKQIVQATPKGCLTAQMLYASLNFRGPRNGHLAIPKDYDGTYDMRRPSFLTGDEDIGGDFLVFDYCSHKEWLDLTEFESLTAVEIFVLGEFGVFHLINDFVLVFEHFRLHPYRVSYRAKTGARVIFERDKMKNLDDWPFPERRMEWLRHVRARTL